MKKRSLVAAIAMLVVSAIVLTSSTYAWFTTSSTATVNSIQASVSNNSGLIQVAATGSRATADSADVYKTAIGEGDYYPSSFSDASLPSGKAKLVGTLSPVSMKWASGETAPSWGKVSYDGEKFTNFQSAAGNEYLEYQFKVKAENTDTDNQGSFALKPSFTPNAKGFTYGMIRISATAGSTTTTSDYIYTSGSYEPVIALPTGGSADNSSIGIVNEGDGGITSSNKATYLSATLGTGGYFDAAHQNQGSITFNIPAATTSNDTVVNGQIILTITVYVWAEGQDADCTGGLAAQTTGFSFTVE